jgi:hypothetical protein
VGEVGKQTEMQQGPRPLNVNYQANLAKQLNGQISSLEKAKVMEKAKTLMENGLSQCFSIVGKGGSFCQRMPAQIRALKEVKKETTKQPHSGCRWKQQQ